MIKLCGAVYRKQGWTDAECLAHYRERHGPLIAALDVFKRNLVQYRQNYLSMDPDAIFAGGMAERPAAISEIWFETIEAARTAFGDPLYLDIGRADELSFCDLSKGMSVFGVEHIITPLPQIAHERRWALQPRWQAFVYQTARSGMSRRDFHAGWVKAQHAIAAEPWYREHVRGHIQLHAFDDGEGLRRPTPYDLVDQYLFDNEADASAFWRRSCESPIMEAAGAEMADPGRTQILIGQTHIVFGVQGLDMQPFVPAP